MTPRPHPPLPALILGATLIVGGLLLTLAQLNLLDLNRVAPFWPVAPMALGLARMRDHGPWKSLFDHALVASGLVFLALNFGRDEWVERGLPLLLVWAGVVLCGRAIAHHLGATAHPADLPPPSSETLNEPTNVERLS